MLEHLVSDHEHSFEGEATAAFVDLIFQTSEDVHRHEVVRVLGPEVVDLLAKPGAFWSSDTLGTRGGAGGRGRHAF